MSTTRKTASALAATSLLVLCGLGAAPSASAADAGGSTPPAAPVVTDAGGARLTSYDPATGQAVVATGGSGSAAGAVKVGQVIDSLPSAVAPKGALLMVTGVQKATDGQVAVSTRPAAVNELLGANTASLHTEVAPSSIAVTPQLPGLKVTYKPRIDGASGSASAGLELNADTDLDLPDGTSAAFSGSMELDAGVDFDYTGTAFDLKQARVGFTTDARADWHVQGTFKGSTGDIKIPIASLNAAPVVWAGPIPVVVNVDLTLYAHISANGTVTVDTEDSYDGSWGVHADYTKQGGWTKSTDSGSTTHDPATGTVSGKGDIHTGLLTEGTIALYNSLGVKVGVEPYLRTVISGRAVLDYDGTVESLRGSVDMYGGLNIGGSLLARLKIMGATLFERDLPFTIYNREQRLLHATR
ncbi:hypothetical protein GCM10010441_26240 [Kitasatospora paracochleata]|uniref:Uncharacterized protein n=1 Tax=Kitasatospora paracochleata TaxID=58354 RepID=A0ABT1IW29_9ACTN|nr:hypothetical protein [Kitasatospora paracochleata]MCP2309345.1 hypothetical protein [Kitasatospora paracochleata]